MSKILRGPMRGSSGKNEDLQLIYKFYRETGTTVAQRLPAKRSVPVRYWRQMEQRCQVASVANCYGPFRGLLAYASESGGLSTGRRMFNDFLKHNLRARLGCYLTQGQREAGFQVLGNFIVSVGPESMPSIEVKELEDIFVTNISLGDLEITPETTQAELAEALGRANPSRFWVDQYAVSESITFMIAHQLLAVGTSKPTIAVEAMQVPLLTDGPARARRLVELVDVERLTCREVITDGVTHRCLALKKENDFQLFTIIHSRRMGDGSVICSTQALAGVNPLRDIFLTDEARAQAFMSYGGVNEMNAADPLNPRPARFAAPTPADLSALRERMKNDGK